MRTLKGTGNREFFLQNIKPLMKSLQNYVLEHNSYLILLDFT